MNTQTEKQIVSVARWTARIVGVLLLLEIATFAIGEGTVQHLREVLLTQAFLAMVAGLIAAWKWEGVGSLLILGGFATFVTVNGGLRLRDVTNPVFGPFLLTGLLFLYCWWRTPKRQGPPMERP